MAIKQFIRRSIIIFCSLFSRSKDSKVIFYHDVHNTTSYTPMSTHISALAQHIEVAKNLGYEFVSQITQRQNQLMVCFDDGFKGIWDNRLFFVENNIYPTVFIAVDLINKDGYLSVEEIKELYGLGFTFQAHSWSHDDLSKYSTEELHKELVLSKIELERLTGFHIDEICFPQGYYSDMVVSEARKAGYRKMYSSEPRPYFKRNTEDIIPRYLVQHANKKLIRAILQGGMDVLYAHYHKLHKR